MKNIILRKYSEKADYSALVNLFYYDENQYLWGPATALNNQETCDYYIKNRFRKFYHEFNVISDQKASFIGIIYSHSYAKEDGHLQITTVISPEYRGLGYGAIASIKFMNFLFIKYNIHKIFIPVYSFNAASYNNCYKAKLKYEGCLSSYKYHDGNYHDLHYFSINRPFFYDKFASYMK